MSVAVQFRDIVTKGDDISFVVIVYNLCSDDGIMEAIFVCLVDGIGIDCSVGIEQSECEQAEHDDDELSEPGFGAIDTIEHTEQVSEHDDGDSNRDDESEHSLFLLQI